MKLTMHPYSVNGKTVERGQFGYWLKPGIGFEPAGVDAIEFRCPKKENGVCVIDLTLGPHVDLDKSPDGKRRWHWDGNMQSPTITPSIGCDKRCGWHGNITNGEIAP